MKYLSIILIGLLALTGCFNPPEPIEYTGELFPLTLTGQNLLAFNIGDEVWVPQDKSSIDCNVITGVISNISISAYSIHEINGYINFTFRYDTTNKAVTYAMASVAESSISNCNDYESEKDLYIDVVQLDMDSSIVSGYFEFPNLKDRCNNMLKITNGRFDLKF